MNGTISIYDPASKLRFELDPATKTAARKRNPEMLFEKAPGATGFRLVYDESHPPNPAATKGVMAETTESLGTQSINGVTAQGVRTTMTIPKGQIGNNRDIKILTERWTSDDLQMLVRSINSDPRFGDTTYQLTKVVRSAPDPALFQVPADYTVTGQGVPLLKGKQAEGPFPALPAPANLPGK
jgi:hypothetical protein